MSEVNRENKDRLFRFIFGRPENKEWTLSLYNAVNGSHYTDPELLEITTIEDALYMSMKNDLSFLIADTMNFYEHQASVNPNMPICLFCVFRYYVIAITVTIEIKIILIEHRTQYIQYKLWISYYPI